MRFGILREEKREEDLPNELQLGSVGKEVYLNGYPVDRPEQRATRREERRPLRRNRTYCLYEALFCGSLFCGILFCGAASSLPAASRISIKAVKNCSAPGWRRSYSKMDFPA
jgi:hypothetical protein